MNSETKITLKALNPDGIVEELYLLVLKDDKLFMASMLGKIELDKLQDALKGLDYNVITKTGELSSVLDF